MSDTRRVVDGEDKTRVRPLRPAAPLDGPLAESGAAPDPVPTAVPRPRRPWLGGRTTDAKTEIPAAPVTTTAAVPPSLDAATGDRPGDTATGDLAAARTSSDTTAAAADPDAPTAAADASTVDADDAEAGSADAAADSTAGSPKRADAEGDTAKTDDAKSTEPTADDATATSTAGATAKTDTTKADTTKTDTAKADTATATSAAGAAAADLTVTRVDGVAVVPTAERRRRRRVPFAHAVRLPPPRQAAVTAARATRAWSRRPSGRLTVPGVFLLALVAATAAAGALLVPATIRGSRPVAADVTTAPTVAVPPALPLDPRQTGPLPTGPLPTGAFPSGGMPTGPAVGPTIGGRPSDSLAAWAQQVGARLNIPATAVQAYGYAELVLAQTNRSCALSWTTLAAIGQVESEHGSANGARLGSDGKALPEIIGLPLDGNGGRMRIIDTDRGVLDKDRVFDRAIGPMQFIPTTWQEIGADADNDGRKDPHDLDDAALAAGNYLCKGGRNLSIPGDWWNAILSYNDVRRYAQAVYDTADRYGRASRT
ncbi:lytic transglycosylase domain-containing protein [Micromonospora sp. DT43]|uniref:lytic transglycosylase domain-containing protein n=1 Tax=Micromonospora sp. DT43 TaxID=3393440 RepID=UPI003CF7AC4C